MAMFHKDEVSKLFVNCFEGNCTDYITECFSREVIFYNESDPNSNTEIWSSRYGDASASFVVFCAILMFFMKAGFLLVEESFSKDDPSFRRRVVLAKYIDIFAGTIGFWLFGYGISNSDKNVVLGEEQDYLFWFFRFTFATNTATILGGTLVGHGVQMRTTAIFIYSFVMTAFIHPFLARLFWSTASTSSPYGYCDGTFTISEDHNFTRLDNGTQENLFHGKVFLDFAGSGLVHLCGGIGGLVLAIFHKMETDKTVQKIREYITSCSCCRKKRDYDPFPDHEIKSRSVDNSETSDTPSHFFEWMYPSGGGDEHVENAALGILILWTTWFAFNAGSTEIISGKRSHGIVGRIAIVMCLACASAGIVQTLVSGLVQLYKGDKSFNTNQIANVVLGALVAVTGCCSFIEPHHALAIGGITVGVYHLGCFIEYHLGLHDGAKVFPVHGMCGFWGIVCVGLFGRISYIADVYDPCFCVSLHLPLKSEGPAILQLLQWQLAGGLFITVWSFLTCALVFLVLWLLPVKIILNCIPWLFRLTDTRNRKGNIEFVGNVLFTNCDEIKDPGPPTPPVPPPVIQQDQVPT